MSTPAPNEDPSPRIQHLRKTQYFDTSGKRVPLGSEVRLMEEYTSFGNLNGDGTDDAVAVVWKNDRQGGSYFFAAMLNHDQTLFEIAAAPIGKTFTMYSHHATDLGFVVDC